MKMAGGEPLPHQDAKKERVTRLGRIREVVFGLQDGLLSTVGFVAGLHGATASPEIVLIGGMMELVAGATSMGVGAYLSSQAERDVFEQAVREEHDRYREEPYLAYEQLMEALQAEGVARARAYQVVKLIREHEGAFLRTFREKVLGLGEVAMGNPLAEAALMAASFACGAAVVVLPYLVLQGAAALAAAVGIALLALFGIGAVKGRLAGQGWAGAGLRTLLIASGAALLGYLVGLLLPDRSR